MRLVFVDGIFDPEIARETVQANLPTDAEVVITTRVDNDDAIAKSYVSAIQASAASHGHGVFLNFTRGIQFAARRLYYRSDPSNAFISLVEAIDGPVRTVFVDQHHQLHRHGPIVQIHTHPMWLQAIHGSNLANQARGVRADPRWVGPHFALDLDIRSDSSARLRADQAFTALRMTLRVIRNPKRIKWLLRTLR